MAIRPHPYDCGHAIIGGWHRYNIPDLDKKECWSDKTGKQILDEVEKEIKKAINLGYTMVSCTVLKEQAQIRALLRKHGFKKGLECESKYKRGNTLAIYYWRSEPVKVVKRTNKGA